MKAKQQLRKPENWPDFESLCKKLWGEIWKCPEIKKNGRQGQNQHGVDIYGIPYEESEYFGIQCKGKDDYSQKKLTEREIDVEIKKAKTFVPPLKKFFFTTTANKDAGIESYIRKKNIENIKKHLFEVHLFSWEDIVDLIEENKGTYDYYVKSINFKTEYNSKLTFENGEDKLTVKVPFLKTITHYKQRIIPAKNLWGIPTINFDPMPKMMHLNLGIYENSINHSYCRFNFKLFNLGIEPIKDYKIFLEFDGEYNSIDNCSKGDIFIINPKVDTFIWGKEKQGKIIPLNNILVQEDNINFDTICLKPYPKPSDIIFYWKLVSSDYKNEGVLYLNIIPEFIIKEESIIVDDQTEYQDSENIEDYITNK